MAMVFRASIEVPWDGRDFEGVNAARKMLAGVVHDIGKAMNGEVEYTETVTNTRNKVDAP